MDPGNYYIGFWNCDIDIDNYRIGFLKMLPECWGKVDTIRYKMVPFRDIVALKITKGFFRKPWKRFGR